MINIGDEQLSKVSVLKKNTANSVFCWWTVRWYYVAELTRGIQAAWLGDPMVRLEYFGLESVLSCFHEFFRLLHIYNF